MTAPTTDTHADVDLDLEVTKLLPHEWCACQTTRRPMLAVCGADITNLPTSDSPLTCPDCVRVMAYGYCPKCRRLWATRPGVSA